MRTDIAYQREKEQENRTKGILSSVVMHALLILAVLFAPMATPKSANLETKIDVELPPDKGLGGEKIALGLPNQGQGKKAAPGKPDPNAGSGDPAPTNEPVKEKPTPKPPTSKPVEPVIRKPTATPTPRPPVVTDDPAVVEARRQEAAAKRAKEEERVRQESAEREKQREENEAKAKAQEEANKKAAAKGKYGGRFGSGKGDGTNGGGGTGTGRGNTGTPGNQGLPDGDPDASKLSGTAGSGKVGGNLGNRKLVSKPNKLEDDSQVNGRVILEICVDTEGNVTTAKLKRLGSTVTDEDLVAKATRHARQYKFGEGMNDECGTITYDFKVK
jgi:outer membrane biosynthesis protein TonB